jgi:protein-S-isoprenylcysteine O-methyltransferase Ste14
MSWLPSLGPRGEGWVAGQVVLFALIVATGFPGGDWAGALRSATTALAGLLGLAGILLAGAGFRDLGTNLTPLPHPREEGRLVEDGAYRFVRHPIYGGLVLVAVAWGLFAASAATLLADVLLLVFFVLKSSREEAWLAARYPAYAAYRARTRRLIPWLF